MNITRKEIILFIAQLIPIVGILFLFTDVTGALFIGDDFTVRAGFRWKLFFFLTVFTATFLTATNIFKSPLRQLIYIGYPIYLLILLICGAFTASHNLMGYKIALLIVPIVAQVLKWYGKGLLRRYLPRFP